MLRHSAVKFDFLRLGNISAPLFPQNSVDFSISLTAQITAPIVIASTRERTRAKCFHVTSNVCVSGVKLFPPICEVIYQTRETVFHRDIQTPRESWKNDAQRSIFDEIRGVWITDETLSRVFQIYSQSKQKLKSKQRSKIDRQNLCYLRPGIQTSFTARFCLFLRIINEFEKTRISVQFLSSRLASGSIQGFRL